MKESLKLSLAHILKWIVGARISIDILLDDTTLTSSSRSISIYSGRKFSDYDLILFMMKGSSSNYRKTMLLPSLSWKSGTIVDINELHGGSWSTTGSYSVTTQVFAYESDTSLKANTNGANAIKILQIVGIRFVGGVARLLKNMLSSRKVVMV